MLRARGYGKKGNLSLSQRKTPEQQERVEKAPCKSISEEGNRRDVADYEPFESSGVEPVKSPDPEIRYHEKEGRERKRVGSLWLDV